MFLKIRMMEEECCKRMHLSWQEMLTLEYPDKSLDISEGEAAWGCLTMYMLYWNEETETYDIHLFPDEIKKIEERRKNSFNLEENGELLYLDWKHENEDES